MCLLLNPRPLKEGLRPFGSKKQNGCLPLLNPRPLKEGLRPLSIFVFFENENLLNPRPLKEGLRLAYSCYGLNLIESSKPASAQGRIATHGEKMFSEKKWLLNPRPLKEGLRLFMAEGGWAAPPALLNPRPLKEGLRPFNCVHLLLN